MGFVEIVDGYRTEDERGFLSKFVTFNSTLNGIQFPLSEAFRSKTYSGYVRGLHFQTSSSENDRLIHVLSGLVFTQFIDLRMASNSFGEIFSIESSGNDNRTFVVPKGVAHGFQALEDCEILYLSEKPHDPNFDTGVNPLSVQFKWPKKIRGISARDKKLPFLDDFLNG
jgi:dTDP-4-dehydrorhamnose 3,5-epimerase